MADKKHIDEISGVETTGHEWDGIRELNNPMPRWWVYTFYATIVWAIGYAIAYPAWPLIKACRGGVFVLCTSLRAMKRIHELIEDKLSALAACTPASRSPVKNCINARSLATSSANPNA